MDGFVIYSTENEQNILKYFMFKVGQNVAQSAASGTLVISVPDSLTKAVQDW